MSFLLLLCLLRNSIGVVYAEASTTQAASCNIDWNVKKFQENSLTIAWSGEGDGNVTVTLTEICSYSTCPQSSVTTNFSENRVELKPWSNMKYEVDIAFNCPYSNEKKRNRTIWAPSAFPYAPKALRRGIVTNTTVFLYWSEPTPFTGTIQMYYVNWRNFQRYACIPTYTNSTSFTVRNLIPYTKYTFWVQAVMQAEVGKPSAELLVQTDIGIPSVPLNFRVKSFYTFARSAAITWSHPLYPNAPEIKYKIMLNMSSSTEEIWSECTEKLIPGKKKVDYDIYGLSPYTEYSVRVSAITDVGQGPWTPFQHFRTADGIPNEPMNLKATKVSVNAVKLTWEEPVPRTGPIKWYNILFSEKYTITFRLRTYDRWCIVEGLSPFTEYYVDVSAQTSAGGGTPARILLKTLLEVPDPPQMKIEGTQNTSISVSWILLKNYRPRPMFSLRWKAQGGSYTFKNIEVSSKENRFTITELTPYTVYEVQVRGINAAGMGNWSKPQAIQTTIGVPSPAVIQEITALVGNSVRIDWTTRGLYPGPLNYVVRAWNIPGLCSASSTEYQANVITGTITRDQWIGRHSDIMTGLRSFGEYRFEIVLFTSATNGVMSNKSKEFQIPPEAAEEPMNVTAECSFSSTEATVSWKPPKESNGVIFSYVVEYAMEGQHSFEELPVANMCEGQTLTLTGLRPERHYDIRVYARVQDVRGDGKAARLTDVCILPAGVPYLSNTPRVTAKGFGPTQLVLEWTEDSFSDYMGRLVRYAVLVGRNESLGKATGGTIAVGGPTWFTFKNGGTNFYQATPPSWNPFTGDSEPLECVRFFKWQDGRNRSFLRCVIGCETSCVDDTYCNGPLEPDTLYEIKIRGFTKGGYNETDPILARTDLPKKNLPTGTIPAAVVFVLGSLGGGGYVIKSKGYLNRLIRAVRLRRSRRRRSQSLNILEQNMRRQLPPKPIKCKDFEKYLRNMMKNSHLKLSKEFQIYTFPPVTIDGSSRSVSPSLSVQNSRISEECLLKTESPHFPCTIAEMNKNNSKNRLENILPFDHSRVKLLPKCDEPGSDFINASYIPGFSARREYICCQGPLPNTVHDFWRMISEKSVSMVVMLTQCVERNEQTCKKKCEQYWPDSGKTNHYGDLRVTCASESILPSYIIRILNVQQVSCERQVKQMQFIRWPDYGCPDNPEDLITFVKAVRDHLPREDPGPILIHSSAGVGRAGAFIALDRLSQQIYATSSYPDRDTVDILATVLELRHHRTNMVQTENQYIYIYQCVRQLILERDTPRLRWREELV